MHKFEDTLPIPFIFAVTKYLIMTNHQLQHFQSYLSQPISIKRLELVLLDLPQKMVFQSGIGIRKSRKALIVKWIDKDGTVGYGECSCRPDPYYSDEFIDASFLLIEYFIVPYLASCKTYQDLLNLLEKIRGWPFTKAAVEFALHDLLYRKTGKMLFDYWERERLEKIPVGISLGIQNSQALIRLLRPGLNGRLAKVCSPFFLMLIPRQKLHK